jgi:hypothetical protein
MLIEIFFFSFLISVSITLLLVFIYKSIDDILSLWALFFIATFIFLCLR